MTNTAFIDFILIASIGHSRSFTVLVSLKSNYVYSDTGRRTKNFLSYAEALSGSKLLNLTKVVKSVLINGRIPPKMVCPFKEKCSKTKNSCGHLGLDHLVNYSCRAAQDFNLTN